MFQSLKQRTSACFISITVNKALYIEDDGKQDIHSSGTEQIRQLFKSLSDQGANFTSGQRPPVDIQTTLYHLFVWVQRRVWQDMNKDTLPVTLTSTIRGMRRLSCLKKIKKGFQEEEMFWKSTWASSHSSKVTTRRNMQNSSLSGLPVNSQVFPFRGQMWPHCHP